MTARVKHLQQSLEIVKTVDGQVVEVDSGTAAKARALVKRAVKLSSKRLLHKADSLVKRVASRLKGGKPEQLPPGSNHNGKAKAAGIMVLQGDGSMTFKKRKQRARAARWLIQQGFLVKKTTALGKNGRLLFKLTAPTVRRAHLDRLAEEQAQAQAELEHQLDAELASELEHQVDAELLAKAEGRLT